MARPLFTRRHYEAMATALRSAFTDEYALRRAGDEPRCNTETIGDVVRHMARVYALDNPRFDATRFYKAAGCLPDGTPDYTIAD